MRAFVDDDGTTTGDIVPDGFGTDNDAYQLPDLTTNVPAVIVKPRVIDTTRTPLPLVNVPGAPTMASTPVWVWAVVAVGAYLLFKGSRGGTREF